jgi:hypothetical protein
MVADAGPPIVVMAIGLVLWLAVTSTVSGISIQTVGVILFVLGLVWLVFEMLQARAWPRRRAYAEPPVAYEQPVVREDPVVYRDRIR